MRKERLTSVEVRALGLRVWCVECGTPFVAPRSLCGVNTYFHCSGVCAARAANRRDGVERELEARRVRERRGVVDYTQLVVLRCVEEERTRERP